ncbi:hypothetical protein QBC39DRAFT_77052 [Podospora conica]|nr:hypothetical protein QBC39DRAFT_77052 [Schizothecium conicum]
MSTILAIVCSCHSGSRPMNCDKAKSSESPESTRSIQRDMLNTHRRRPVRANLPTLFPPNVHTDSPTLISTTAASPRPTLFSRHPPSPTGPVRPQRTSPEPAYAAHRISEFLTTAAVADRHNPFRGPATGESRLGTRNERPISSLSPTTSPFPWEPKTRSQESRSSVQNIDGSLVGTKSLLLYPYYSFLFLSSHSDDFMRRMIQTPSSRLKPAGCARQQLETRVSLVMALMLCCTVQPLREMDNQAGLHFQGSSSRSECSPPPHSSQAPTKIPSLVPPQLQVPPSQTQRVVSRRAALNCPS